MACRDREKVCSVRNVCRESRGRTAALLQVVMATRDVSGKGKGPFGASMSRGCAGWVHVHVYPCLLGTCSRNQPREEVFSCICSFGSLRHLAYRPERARRMRTTSVPERGKAAVLHKCLS